MKLVDVVTASITVKRTTGMRCRSAVDVLKAFCRTMGDIELSEVSPQRVQAFVGGHGPVTSFWHQKYTVLDGFYRFARSEEHTSELQSQSNLVCRLLLEKKKTIETRDMTTPL